MKIHEMMTRTVFTVAPTDRLKEAAGLMRLHDVGVLPVIEDNRVVGMLTDRDIVLRAVAEDVDVRNVPVSEAMSVGSITVGEDQTVEEAAQLMQQYQIRRMPVVSPDGKVTGIISLGDVAVDVHAGLAGEVIKEVSDPAMPLA